MDTLIIGGQRYDIPSNDADVVIKAQELLRMVKQVSVNCTTEEQFENVYEILDEIEALVV